MDEADDLISIANAPKIPWFRNRRLWIAGGLFGGGFGLYYTAHVERVSFTGRSRFMNISVDSELKMGQYAYVDVMKRHKNQILPSNHPVARAFYSAPLLTTLCLFIFPDDSLD